VYNKRIIDLNTNKTFTDYIILLMLHNTFQYILNFIYIGQINNFKVQSLYKRLK